MALTDIKVRTAKPTDKQYKLTDGNGMHLLVHPNGSKYWRLQYRFGGKQKMLALGGYPDVSLADARARRDEARKLLANSIDPGDKKKMIRLNRKKRALLRSLLLSGTLQIKSGRKNIADECLKAWRTASFQPSVSVILPN